MLYPPNPEPHTVEIEATNHCSARCNFCPHPVMTRSKGYLDPDAFVGFLVELARDREELWIYRASGGALPRIVFAGLGEPTLHPRLAEMVEASTRFGFRTQVVTNGAHLSDVLLDRLVAVGLDNLAISLHTLDPAVYYDIMKLPLAGVLPKIQAALARLAATPVDVELWRVLPPPGRPRESAEASQRFADLIGSHPEVRILGPSEPWSRDSTVSLSAWPVADDSARGGIWCHRLYFTYNVAWDGTVVMCCVDFHRATVELGNVFHESFAEIQRRRAGVFRGADKPPICRGCRRWEDEEYVQVYREFIAQNLGGIDPSLHL